MLLAMVIPASAVLADPTDVCDYEVSATSQSGYVTIPDVVEKRDSVTIKYTNADLIDPAVANQVKNVSLKQGQTDLTASVVSYEVPSGKGYVVFTIDTSSGFVGNKLYNLSFNINDSVVGCQVKFYVDAAIWNAAAEMDAGSATATIDVTGATGSVSKYVQIKGLSHDAITSLSLDSITIPGVNTVALYGNTDSTGFPNGGFFLINLKQINASNVVNGTYDLVMMDGSSNVYTLHLTLTGGTDPATEHTVSYNVDGGTAVAPNQEIISEGSTFFVASYSGIKEGHTFGGWSDGVDVYSAGDTYLMSTSDVIFTAVWNISAYSFEVIGTVDAPNVHVPAGLILDNRYCNITVRYSNDAIDPLSEISETQVLVDDNPNYSYVIRLTATHPSGTNYIVLNAVGSCDFKAPSLVELRVSLSSGDGLRTFSVFIPSEGYWLGSVDSTSGDEQSFKCIKQESNQGEFQLGISGITSIDSINCSIPGVSLSGESDNFLLNAGLVTVKGVIDWTSVVNGTYPVTVTTGANDVRFNLVLSKATCIDSVDYDYEFVGVTNHDSGSIEWDLGLKQSLLIKVQLPDMVSDVVVNGYCEGSNDQLSSVAGVVIKANSIADKYVIFELTNNSLASPSSLVVWLSCDGAGLVGKLAITITGTAPSSQNDDKYELECVVTQVDANIRLTIDITKSTSAPSLENAKLLVIAKYQGGIVVNFYSSPSLTNGNGTDVIEVSSQNLREIIVEIVDGFQHSTPVFYGYCVYKNVGGN